MPYELISPQALCKLKWRTRRGMLENDLFIQRFFQRYEHTLNTEHERGLYALMDLSDNDLLDLLLRRKPLAAVLSLAIDQAPQQTALVLQMLHECVQPSR